MADKYIVSGCSFCGKGDGPLIPTEAAHNDAAGYAWGLTSTDTDAINIFMGAAPKFGTAIAANDTVYIRSKTAAGADVTTTISANTNFGSTLSNVTWVIDAGTKWADVNGVVTFTTSSNQMIARASNNYYADAPDGLRFVWTFAAANQMVPGSASGNSKNIHCCGGWCFWIGYGYPRKPALQSGTNLL
jgi:hypothetical protein